MRKRLGILACVAALAIALICPSMCAAKESAHSCCDPSQHKQATCEEMCQSQQSILIPDITSAPQLDLGMFVLVPAQTFTSAFISQPEKIATLFFQHPPGHLVFLNTIRLQC